MGFYCLGFFFYDYIWVNRFLVCGKYGGLFVKCDWVFSFIVVVCGGIL